jgi:hypothetical protein
VLVRCLGLRWGWSPRGPRPAAGLGWLRVSGSGSGPPLDARFFVPEFSRHDCSLARPIGGSATAQALLRLQIHRWRARRGRGSSFAWNGPREGRISRPPNVKGTHDSSFERSRPKASAFTTGSRSQRRNLALLHTNAEACVHPVPKPQPETPDQRRRQPPGQGLFGDQTQRRPRQRTSGSRPPQAAHERVDAPAGSARASRRPRGQRTSGSRPPQAAHQQVQTPCCSTRPHPGVASAPPSRQRVIVRTCVPPRAFSRSIPG